MNVQVTTNMTAITCILGILKIERLNLLLPSLRSNGGE